MKNGRFGAAVVLALALSGCGGASTPAKGAGGPEFVYITDAPIGVNQFLELGRTGTRDAAAALGGTSRTFESNDTDQSRRSNIEAAVAARPKAIVLITFEFDDLSVEYAEAHPDQQFVLIDSCPDGTVPANLRCGVFKEYEASYLLGVEAGLLTRSDRVGTVAAIDIPFFHRWSNSFALGARSVNPKVSDRQLFVGGDNPVGDPARAKELALTVAQAGADQVFAVTGGGNGGVFEAAKETGALAYGVDVNQCPQAPGSIVDNAIKRIDVVVKDLLTSIVQGRPGGTSTAYGLAEQGSTVTSLTEDAAGSQCAIMKHPEILARVREARDKIVSGEIVVPDPVKAG
ncbi:BMP family ABC transporter substrate-binding protein [Nonomuraea zeae]|uniref:BMP family ABC transporter substrate-binding protein n=1 Tax=Nonomuraea zeae TaxID=1642303 RepID=A0A5S4GT91_9ACTN|nr:BMP family ABC transporter substrate-binding protein [Nonomuraea zeae]TMR35962.1 BMP family ABC transporter substrate-binding protein [Nonomuraea zeae]